jgi:hypothetical protein
VNIGISFFIALSLLLVTKVEAGSVTVNFSQGVNLIPSGPLSLMLNVDSEHTIRITCRNFDGYPIQCSNLLSNGTLVMQQEVRTDFDDYYYTQLEFDPPATRIVTNYSGQFEPHTNLPVTTVWILFLF